MTLLEALAVASRKPSKLPASRSWVHICNGLDPRRDGGMVPSILGMAGGLAGKGGAVRIVTPTPSSIDKDRIPSGLSLEGPETSLERAVRWADVVHIHGLWQGHTRRAAAESRRHRIPHLIAAHGMADPWALRQKRWKKLLYSILVEYGNLRNASCLHALTRPEVTYLRRMAPRVPVALVPNGVDLAPLQHLPDRAELEKDHPKLRDKFVVLFFSRVHKKKGLDLLAPALAKVAREYPQIHLVLAGIDDGALGPFLDASRDLGIQDHITYVGHVGGDDARRVWGAADAFVLPSHSEGFSMAVLEALACRLPVMITTACNFPELGVEHGGLIVDPTTTGVESGLRELLAMSAADRRSMASNGRRLVESRYTWDRQAQHLVQVYEWLSGGGARPEAIQ